jgi:hypothetical protein
LFRQASRIGTSFNIVRDGIYARAAASELHTATTDIGKRLTLFRYKILPFDRGDMNKQGNPPALPGDSKSLTFPRVLKEVIYSGSNTQGACKEWVFDFGLQ